jgi:hypothetical protein
MHKVSPLPIDIRHAKGISSYSYHTKPDARQFRYGEASRDYLESVIHAEEMIMDELG